MIILPLEPPKTIHDCLLTENRATDRETFSQAIGCAKNTLATTEQQLSDSLPVDWRFVTYVNARTRVKRRNLCPYSMWVLHAVRSERSKYFCWTDYARAISRCADDKLSFAHFQRNYEAWATSLCDRQLAQKLETRPALFEAIT